jgi:hypothetical protein
VSLASTKEAQIYQGNLNRMTGLWNYGLANYGHGLTNAMNRYAMMNSYHLNCVLDAILMILCVAYINPPEIVLCIVVVFSLGVLAAAFRCGCIGRFLFGDFSFRGFSHHTDCTIHWAQRVPPGSDYVARTLLIWNSERSSSFFLPAISARGVDVT